MKSNGTDNGQLPFQLKTLRLAGLLSYPPTGVEVPLGALSVLIGPNASGKTNLIESLALLQAVPTDVAAPLRGGGGARAWLWNGVGDASGTAKLEIVCAGVTSGQDVRYRLTLGLDGTSMVVRDERVENASPNKGSQKPFFYFGYEQGRAMVNRRLAAEKPARRALHAETFDRTQSVLAQRSDPDQYPELARLRHHLRSIAIYRQWTTGPRALLRDGCRTDLRTDRLDESFENLPARLSALKAQPVVKKLLLEHLRALSPGFDDLEIPVEGGRLQMYLTEGDRQVSAARLSDGTLRFLALLAILLDPTPPPVIVIEEPELGLHHDVLPTVRDLLVAACERTQLVVTTHSPTFIDAFSETPDAVVVCEKDESGTRLTRLKPGMRALAREHGLGRLWMQGELGGTRW